MDEHTKELLRSRADHALIEDVDRLYAEAAAEGAKRRRHRRVGAIAACVLLALVGTAVVVSNRSSTTPTRVDVPPATEAPSSVSGSVPSADKAVQQGTLFVERIFDSRPGFAPCDEKTFAGFNAPQTLYTASCKARSGNFAFASVTNATDHRRSLHSATVTKIEHQFCQEGGSVYTAEVKGLWLNVYAGRRSLASQPEQLAKNNYGPSSVTQVC